MSLAMAKADPITQSDSDEAPLIARIHPTKVIRGKYHGLRTSAVHIIPLILTFFILLINFLQVYWFPPSGLDNGKTSPNTVQNSLQLAAKLYELFVVASLAGITLKVFKRQLVDNGVPLGLVSGAYRVGDVKYLTDLRYWSGFVTNKGPLLLSILLLVNTVLSVLVGPASAILIVPALGWFSLPSPFSKVQMPIFLDTPEELWPQVLNEGLWSNETICLENKGILFTKCPAAGYSEIFTWAAGWQHSGLPDNITFKDPPGVSSRRLYSHSGGSSGTFLSVVTALAAGTAGQLQSYIRSHDVGSISSTEIYRLASSSSSVYYEPLVNAKCDVWNLRDYANASEIPPMWFPSSSLNCFTTDGDDDCHRMRNLFGKWKIGKGIVGKQDGAWQGFDTVTSEDEADWEGNAISSVIYTARLPYIQDGEIGARFAACSYIAHWIPTTLAVDPSNTDIIESNVTDLSVFASEADWKTNAKHPAVGPMIQIDKSWLRYVNLGYDKKNTTSEGASEKDVEPKEEIMNVGTLMMALLLSYKNETGKWKIFGPGSSQPSESDGDRVVQLTLEKFTGAILANGISRAGATAEPALFRRDAKTNTTFLASLQAQQGPAAKDYEIFENGTIVGINGFRMDLGRSPSERIADARARYVAWDFTAERYGYGFGLPGGPRNFALVVILAYVLVLLAYCLFVASRQVATIVTWDDLQDLLVLMWTSRSPAELANQGVQVSDKSLWRRQVSVRAMPSGNVTLAFEGKEEGLSKLKMGEDYW